MSAKSPFVLIRLIIPMLLLTLGIAFSSQGQESSNKPYLGIFGDTPTDRAVTGTIVLEVVQGSPAENAGFKVRDVITAIGTTPIASFEDLATQVSSYVPGSKLEVSVLRNGTPMSITVVLGKKGAPANETPKPPSPINPEPALPTMPTLPAKEKTPLPPPEKLGRPGQPRPVIGVITQIIEDPIRTQLNLGSRAGVLISEVDPVGPASRAGLMANDVVTKADGKELNHPRQLAEIILAKKAGDSLNLHVWRKGKEADYVVKVEEVPGLPATGVAAGSLDSIRNRQVEELFQRIGSLEAKISELNSKIDRLTNDLATKKK